MTNHSMSLSDTIQQQKEPRIPNWHIKSDYVETCNCDYGCPCNFNGFPTNGFCRALVFFHIREGNYGDNVKLDGHIYWDQTSLLAQIGLLDTTKLPITGIEQSRKIQQISIGKKKNNKFRRKSK